MQDRTKVVEMRGITKRYAGTVALDRVDFELYEGEVLGLVGDNGAGKSTLIKIISGAVRPDEGEILLNGRRVAMSCPADALRHGIETIYQDLALFGPLDFATNIFAGREYRRGGPVGQMLGVINKPRMEEKAKEVLGGISFNMPAIHEKVENFSGGQKQAVAIARAKLWGQRIIIMDEPTAALGVQESAKVIQMIKDFSRSGTVKGIIIISHNIEHVIEVTDRVIVLRQGKRAGAIDFAPYRDRKDALHADIVKMISGLEF